MAHRCALITGATSGIGESFARLLPRETDLVLTGRDAARLELLGQELGTDGRRVETFAADLAKDTDRAALIDLAAKQPVDLLINNAGFGQFGTHLENPAVREADMIAVNCLSPVVLTRALLPAMLSQAREGGRRAGIIVVASTAAFFPLPRFATYAASKSFDLQFALGLAGELHDAPVDVLALCPGPTRTAFFKRAGMADMDGPTSASPNQVARRGLEALGRKNVEVVGLTNRLAAMVSGVVPLPLLLWAGRRWSDARQQLKA